MDDKVALTDEHVPVQAEGTVLLSVASLSGAIGIPRDIAAIDGRQLLGVLSEIGGALVRSTSPASTAAGAR